MFLTYQFKPCWTIKKCVFFSLFCGTKEAAILSSMGGARRVSREFYSLLINVWQVTLANGNSRTDLQVNFDAITDKKNQFFSNIVIGLMMNFTRVVTTLMMIVLIL